MIETVLELLDKREYKQLRELLDEMTPFDVARLLEELNQDQSLKVFRLLSKDLATDVFSELSLDDQELIISLISDRELAYIIDDLYIDDAVDLVEELPSNVVRRILLSASSETRNQINHFLKYPPNSMGSVMTPEFIKLTKSMTVMDAFRHIKKYAESSATIYVCFVTNQNNFLEGVISIRELFLYDENSLIGDIMIENPISVNTHDDREKAISVFNDYDFVAIPVVDNENRVVGIITHDDILDVIEEETTEDIEKMAAIVPSDKPYLKTSSWDLVKNRIVWLMFLMIGDTFSSQVLQSYENAFQVLPILVGFIPMLIDTGGNAGSQSASLIIRGLALGEIELRDWIKIIFKEFNVGVIAGLILAAINFVRIAIFYPGQIAVALTIALSVLMITIVSKIIGAVLPIIAQRLKLDPAVMASPLITTVVDGLGLIIYFQIASMLLHF